MMKHSTRKILRSNHSGLISNTITGTLNSSHRDGKLIQFKAKPDQNLQKKLILTLDGKFIREYPVTDHNLSIGRRHGNDIQINDPALSSRHALIFCNAKQMYIEDLESLNGTLVNGCQIKQTALKHGDIIQIGHHQLTYLCKQAAPYKPDWFIKAEHEEATIINAIYSTHKGEKEEGSLGALKVTYEKLTILLVSGGKAWP
jgi:pSer/pThr/pTyr-binding forkhead associated (FHA) protein